MTDLERKDYDMLIKALRGHIHELEGERKTAIICAFVQGFCVGGLVLMALWAASCL